MTLPQLTISDEVSAFIGQAGEQSAREAWRRCHEDRSVIACAVCEQPFTSASREPGVVTIESAGEKATVRYVHERCGAGTVVEVDDFSIPKPLDVAFDVRVFPERVLATVSWQPTRREMTIGGRTYPDIYETFWKAHGAITLKTIRDQGGRPDEQIPELDGMFATLDVGNQLEFHYEPHSIVLPGRYNFDIPASTAVTFPPSTEFGGDFAKCAKASGSVRAVLMTNAFSDLSRDELVRLNNARKLPKNALLIGRLPIREV